MTHSRVRPVAFWLAFLLSIPPASATAQRNRSTIDVFREGDRALHAELTADLEEIAAFCEERGLPEAAAAVRASVERGADDELVAVTPLPTRAREPIPTSLPDDERTWRQRLRRTRSEYAGKLYLLARRALRAGHPSYAYELVHDVTELDPDHEAARRLLGWVRSGDRWVTPFASSMIARRYQWHDRFGWLPRTHVARYERGERYYDRRWIPEAQEARLRRDFRNAWTVETAHYVVKTNHSLEEGVRIARALELFHDFFKQVFAGFFVSPDQLETLFNGATRRRRTDVPKHVVHFYHDKRDYVDALRDRFPQIEITNGLYQSGDRIAYFFHDPAGTNLPTIFHEATHQLFYESDGRQRTVAMDAHFWIVEGIACYMESFNRADGKLVVGDPNYIRFDNARYRLLDSGDYLPFGAFSALGMREFQSGAQEELGKRYSQASGFAHFLMHYDHGRYRDALVAHLADLYSPEARLVRSIPELLGVTPAELDQQYAAYLREQSRRVALGDRDRTPGSASRRTPNPATP